MVKTHSSYLPLGTKLPQFEMLNVNSEKMETFNFSSLKDRDLLIIFMCAHCPFVKYVENEISKITLEIQDHVQTIAVSSNDVLNYPDDSPVNLRNQAIKNKWYFPYLYDQDQSFAKKLKAACTPDFYLFLNTDKEFSLFYHGQLDSSRPSNDIPHSGKDLLMAINAIEKDKIPPSPQLPSLGCNIKWKVGEEPNWFN